MSASKKERQLYNLIAKRVDTVLAWHLATERSHEAGPENAAQAHGELNSARLKRSAADDELRAFITALQLKD